MSQGRITRSRLIVSPIRSHRMHRLDDAAYFACDAAYYYTYRTFRGLYVRLRVCVLDISVSRAKTA